MLIRPVLAEKAVIIKSKKCIACGRDTLFGTLFYVCETSKVS